jgi:centromeric protein E
MTGTAQEPGIIPLAVRECFAYLQKERYDDDGNTELEDREYLLRVSYLEVYKEHIKDLLADHHAAVVEPVRLFEHAEKGLIIRGLKEEVVTSPEQVFAILAQGEARRQVGATHLNQHSSRSHVMVRLWIESRKRSSGGGKHHNHGTTRVSSLSLVDLAGSESVRLTGSTERQAEGHYINKSLMTLGKVVYGLSETNTAAKKHVPYRDSKLTRLLQPSLSGNAQVVLVCCISPLVSHIEESHNTFKFAVRAKKIPQKAVIDENINGGDNDGTMLQTYRDEIEDLKQQLREAQRLLQLTNNANNVAGTAQTTTTTSTTQWSASSATAMVTTGPSTADMEEEMQELVTAIRNMEKLILKTKSSAEKGGGKNHKNDDEEDDLFGLSDPEQRSVVHSSNNGSDDGFGDNNDIYNHQTTTPTTMMMTTPPPPPVVAVAAEHLQSELSRIQSLLGTVLQKRYSHDETVRNLRAQLEEQEVTGTLRQADSSFLQKQLAEKDALLEEVSRLLETVEEKQSRLEAENASLRQELARYRQQGNGHSGGSHGGRR